MPTESQLRDAALRAFIGQRIDEGRLPVVLTKTIAVSFGSGGECVACGQTITRAHIEYQAFGPSYGAALRLHWGCHVLWQLECVERTRQQLRKGLKDPRGEPKGESEGEDPSGDAQRVYC